jgi:hypothetical protein
VLRFGGWLAAASVVLAGCIIEAPYTSGRAETPISITLTGARPVAVVRPVVDRSGLPASANVSPSEIRLAGVDARVRAVVGKVTEPSSIVHPTSNGDLRVELAAVDPPQLVFELTDPRPDDRVALVGTIETPFGYMGTPAPDARLTLSGVGDVELLPGSHELTVSAAGPAAVLDADHPVALVPITFGITGGPRASAHGVAAETRFALGPGIPDGAVLATLYRVAEAGGRREAVQVGTSAPMHGCQIERDRTCSTKLMLRWQWTGTVPRVDLRYDVVTDLVGFDGPLDAAVKTSFGAPVIVPPDARSTSAVAEGTVEVGGGDRTNSWFRLRLKEAPASPGGDVVEVPGVVIVTYSAHAKDGSVRPDATLPFHFRDASFFRPSPGRVPEVLDAPIDGTERTVAIPLFAHCSPGADCKLDFWFEIFTPRSADTGPVTVTYRVDARVTSFDRHPLSPATTLTIESTGPNQPPGVD